MDVPDDVSEAAPEGIEKQEAPPRDADTPQPTLKDLAKTRSRLCRQILPPEGQNFLLQLADWLVEGTPERDTTGADVLARGASKRLRAIVANVRRVQRFGADGGTARTAE